MMTAITILETIGIFIVGIVARALFILALFAVLALPVILAALVVRSAGELWHRHVGPHPAPAHAHR